MKPFEKYKLSNIIPSATSTNKKTKNNNNTLYKNDNNYQYEDKINPLDFNNTYDYRTPLNTDSNTINNIISNNKIQSSLSRPILSSPMYNPSSAVYNSNQLSGLKEKEDYDKTIKYINYLKDHLNSSYYANNEINNKNSNLIEKSKFLNDEIKKNNKIYEELLKSIDEKTKENNYYKKQYENILENQKKIKNNNDNMNLNIEEKIKELKQKNLIMNKEKQKQEEILTN